MKIKGYLLVVKDAERSKRFYQDALDATIQLDIGDYVVFEEGFVLLQEDAWTQLHPHAKGAVTYGHNAGELYFDEDELDAFVAKLQRVPGVQALTPITEYKWGQRTMRFCDPDGHVIEVGESMEFVAKRFLRSDVSVEETAAKMMFPTEFVENCLRELQQETE